MGKNKVIKYDVAGFIDYKGESICHDEVITEDLEKAIGIAKSYLLNAEFSEVKIKKTLIDID